MMNLDDYIAERVARIDAELDRYLPAGERLPASLHQAMRYSIFAGGKRIRPLLLIAACEAVGGTMPSVLPAACALEMIHTYSLIHDDLPAMDDDDYRRGRLTNHKVFGEATAILAGDALLTQAFILLATETPGVSVSAAERLRVLQIIATAAGSLGMVGGQVVDMESETKSVELPIVEYIHTHKTGALILAALQAGAILGGADRRAFAALTRYGECAGLAFQIADDILDIVGEQSLLGKDVGSDVQRGKATYPALLGLAESKRRAEELRDLAITALAPLGSEAEPLRALVSFIVERSR
jgi:geranylgeranyl diphosphate synthase, type II